MGYRDVEESGVSFIALVIVVLVVLGGAGWAFHACSVADQATIGRKEMQVQTKNFEESEAYQAGLRRDFDELMLAYAHSKSDDEKATVLAVMRHRAEGVRPDLVPQDVKEMLAKGNKQ